MSERLIRRSCHDAAALGILCQAGNTSRRGFNKLKNALRVATRDDNTAESFLGFIDISSIRLWLRHLSTRPSRVRPYLDLQTMFGKMARTLEGVMSSQKRRSSTRSDPFGQFREIGLNLSIDDGIIEGLGLSSEPLNVFEVDWVGFLGGSELNNPDLLCTLRIQLDDARPSAISALVSMTANIARFIRDIDAAPMPGEIAQQLRDLRAALRQAGSLAQGRKREEPITAQPKGQAKASAYAQHDTVSNALPVGRRSRILHPILHDHIVLAMQRGRNAIANDFALQAFDAHVEKREAQLCEFFDALPELLGWLQDAASFSEELAPVLKRDRKRGAPSNRAGDWAMTRLMWIWRDVLGQDLNIYVRRISGPVELDEPEPNDCVLFIQRAMQRIDPLMLPAGLQSLERKLIDLRKEVPATPLVFGSSRKN